MNFVIYISSYLFIDDFIVDVISDDQEEFWAQDLPLLKSLGVNTLRVYEVDATKGHEKFMNALAELGIYVMFDLQSSKRAINRNDPAYDVEFFEFLSQKLEHLSRYANTLAFIIGNEVANKPGITTRSDAYIKAALRDLKSFRTRKALRKIPIGYAAADDDVIRLLEAQYFICNSAGLQDQTVDFYGVNIYSWCGDSDIETSGYRNRMREFSGYPVPILFTEYGCNTILPRKFTEVPTLFGEMLTVFSGAIAYEYSQEVNNFGIVKISNGTRTQLPDFETLRSQLSNVPVEPISQFHIHTNITWTGNCPDTTNIWQVQGSKLPPVSSRAACQCLDESTSCRVRLASDIVDEKAQSKELGKLISELCGINKEYCADLDSGDAQLGSYGRWSSCPPLTKLSFVISKHQPETCSLDDVANESYFIVSKSDRINSRGEECANMSETSGFIAHIVANRFHIMFQLVLLLLNKFYS